MLQSQNPKYMNSFYSKGHFVEKVWEELIAGILSLGSLWENENMLTGCGEGTIYIPCQIWALEDRQIY